MNNKEYEDFLKSLSEEINKEESDSFDFSSDYELFNDMMDFLLNPEEDVPDFFKEEIGAENLEKANKVFNEIINYFESEDIPVTDKNKNLNLLFLSLEFGEEESIDVDLRIEVDPIVEAINFYALIPQKIPNDYDLLLYCILLGENETIPFGHFGVDSLLSFVYYSYSYSYKFNSFNKEEFEDYLTYCFESIENFYPKLKDFYKGTLSEEIKNLYAEDIKSLSKELNKPKLKKIPSKKKKK